MVLLVVLLVLLPVLQLVLLPAAGCGRQGLLLLRLCLATTLAGSWKQQLLTVLGQMRRCLVLVQMTLESLAQPRQAQQQGRQSCCWPTLRSQGRQQRQL
jgi:hypothetical protein